MIITIDGPAVSGKSTVAQALAKKIGCYYLYSGLLFRAAAYLLHVHAGYTAGDDISEKDIEMYLDPDRLEYVYSEGKGPRILFDEVDITQKLYGPHISQLASAVATNKTIRALLKQMQHVIAKNKSIIVDGRDSGSVIFPAADYKFYLSASLDERAKRMQQSLAKKEHTISLEQSRNDIENRDARDSNRALAPLVKPKDAIEVDTTGLSKQETLKKIMSHLDCLKFDV